MKKVCLVTIKREVEVEIDESKFDSEFMESFRGMFYPFQTLDQHFEHLAQLVARGHAGKYSFDKLGEFIEGYGHVKEMGIVLNDLGENWEVEIFG